MAFVFYDLETSGTNTRFDQILQFAAIRTDADLVEKERVALSCRLDRHMVPHPEALCITERSLAQINDTRLPSHYSMMCAVARLLETWSPAVFIGYNSIRFDEEMLRHSLYRTLHNPYLTSQPGNVRADALTLARGVAFFNPGCISVPIDQTGQPRFKLHMLSEQNGGPTVEAHTAIGDVEAMLALCRQVEHRDQGCWSRFLQFASKKAVAALLDQDGAFGLVRFYGNIPRPTAAVLLGGSDDPNCRYCLDLLADLEWLARASDTEIAQIVASPASPVIKIRINACPCVCELWDLPDNARAGLDDAALNDRAARVLVDAKLGERILAAVLAGETPYPKSRHIEEQLYDALPNAADNIHLRSFHAADWEQRQQLLDGMIDPRWRFLGARLIYLEAPHTLDATRLERMNAGVHARRYAATGTSPWTSVHDAIAWFEKPDSQFPPALADEYRALLF